MLMIVLKKVVRVKFLTDIFFNLIGGSKPTKMHTTCGKSYYLFRHPEQEKKYIVLLCEG